jgi:hypothetical protein
MLLTYEESIQFLQRTHDETVTCLPKKLLLQGTDEAGKTTWLFRPPLLFPRMLPDETLENYKTQVSDVLPDYVILLLRANGNAAIGYFEQGKMLNHKVIRKYMVRQKQGKSQLKHLKTKGKSRLGSRIRLQQTLEFAQEINQKLWDWEVDNAERILVSSSIDVWNLLFKVEPLPPFAKRDERLRKIPYHVQTPNLAELKRVARLLHFGNLMQKF